MASKYAIETAFVAIDKMTAPIQKMEKNIKGFGAIGTSVNSALKKSFADAEKSMDSMLSGAKKAFLGLGASATTALGVFAKDGVKNTLEYEDSLAKLSTVAADLPMDKAAKDILAVSSTMHTAATSIAEDAYNAITAGIDAEHAVDFVATATKVAKAGFAETGTVIDALTDVMGAYGMGAENAMKIADQMILTQNLGKTSIDELTASIGKVAPIASTAGVSTDELFASVAALTSAGSSTNKAMSQVQQMITSVIKPTKTASEMAEQLGLDFSAAALQSKGLAKFLEEVGEATGGDINKISALFGSAEAYKAADILTGKGSKNFTDSLKAMADQAGVTEEAFAKMMKTPAERMAGVKNQFTNAGIKLGQALIPVLEKLADKAEAFAAWMDKNAEKVAKYIGGAAQLVTGLIEVVWKLRVPIVAVAGAVGAFKGLMMAAVVAAKSYTLATNLIKGAQLAYGIVVKGSAAATSAYTFATEGAQAATGAFSLVLKGMQWAKATAGALAHKAATLAVSAAQGVATAATSAWSTAVGVLNALFVASPIGWIILAIGALIAVIVVCVKNWDKITAAVGAAWEKIRQFGSFLGEKLSPIFSAIGDAMNAFAQTAKNAAGVVKDTFLSALNAIWQPIQRIISAFTDGGIVAGIKQIGATILPTILSPVLKLMDTLSKIPIIGDKIGGAKDWISGQLDSLSGGGNAKGASPAPAPQAFVSNAQTQATSHTEVSRSEMQISLQKGLSAQVYGRAPGISVRTQRTGTFD